jgi:predicted dehydrogenase
VKHAEELGIGFVGAGAVAELHHLALQGIPSAKLVALADPDLQRRTNRATEWGIRTHASAEDLVADPQVEAVFVLSPLETHDKAVRAAIAAGKHVLIEKPVGTSATEVRALADLATAAQVVCMPAHNYIYTPELWRARRLISEGALGTICAAWITFLFYHSEELAAHYPGVLRQILTHHFYAVLYLLGRPRRLTALKSRLHYKSLDREDQVMIILEMGDGALVHLCASFAVDDNTSSPWSFLIKVLGTQGGVVHSWRDAFFQRPLGTMNWGIAAYEESFAYEDRHFIAACRGEGAPPLSTMEDAAVAQELIEAAELALAEGRTLTL